MVDQDSGSYRPRRAIIEPEPEPTPPAPPASAPPARTPAARVPAPNFDDEDAPKPLYRDEYRPWSPHQDEPTPVRADPPVNGSGAAHAAANGAANGAGASDEPYGPGADDTAIRSFTFAPRTRRPEDTTTILTRNGSTAHSWTDAPGAEDLDDFDEDEERLPIGERARWGLAIGVIAAVVVLGLAIGYVVLGLDDGRTTAPSPSVTAGSVGPDPTSSVASEPAPTAGGALLDNALMLSAAQAKAVDDGRTWEETLTQRGASDTGPVPTCFGAEPEEGQPVSQQKILRVVSSSGGKNPPKALHDALAYATPEEAATAYTAAAKTLGTCPAAGAWIESGRAVRGLGDTAAGAVVAVGNGKSTEWHSVVIARTGRVVNVLDASQSGKAVAPANVADALAAVVKKQCGPAGGSCDTEASVRNGPPPLGGDEPGFLATGDLPPVAGSATPWEATPKELPSEDFVGASCENVNWATVPAQQRDTRVYLHPDSGTAYFGVNVVLLTVKDEKAANNLVEKIKKDLQSCKERRLTATVSKPKRISSAGARGTEVTGYTTTVEQKGTDGSDKFRVGIVRAGAKVAYTFANPQGDFDFTDDQWNTIAVRAGERATQVN